ncbi:MAG: hypothetical protein C0469_11595 [Cyanobacteria bacterium DS2.3.42]|nr:hypothetical protein [Cyanobacteria bacterium DS2.3.42]
MQPFDALTIRAVLDEAKPLLLNRRVDRVFQLARDELLISLRSKSGMVHLLLSAHATYGRICLVKQAPQGAKNDRAPQNNSNFALLLRKTLASAVLVHIEQLPGERIVDFVFSSTDEVGTATHKVLTAEIMGRHSNLIFWDKTKEKIITASHIVTKEMSRQREVAPGLTYKRPPGQERPNIFKITREEFGEQWKLLRENFQAPAASPDSEAVEAASGGTTTKTQLATAPGSAFVTVEQWLIHTFTGLGRNLSEELILASEARSPVADALKDVQSEEKVWSVVKLLGEPRLTFKPAMRTDLSRYTVLSLIPELKNAEAPKQIAPREETRSAESAGQEADAATPTVATTATQGNWKHFPAVNDLVDEYYSAVEAREQFQQLRERLRNELRSEDDKLASRISVASQHVRNDEFLGEMKRSGDLVLAHLGVIEPGQTELEVDDLYSGSSEKIKIKLNPNLSASQNAQWFYRQFSKSRSRQKAAKLALDEAARKQGLVETQMKQLEKAQTNDELRALRELIIGRKPAAAMQQQQQQNRGPAVEKKKGKPRMLSVTSSDGWTIYVGRNRHENDQLLSKLAQPNDIWLHILGSGGAHVLIRVPASKQEPPLTTLKEAAQIAARLSKGGTTGTKVRVVYTHVKYVKKLGKDKPGQVRYENEKTLEIDTSAPMPKCMKQLFSH